MVPISVKIYGDEGKEKTEAFLNKCLRYLLIAIIPMWFGYMAISKELFITLASAKYAAAARFSPLILLAHFFGAMSRSLRCPFVSKEEDNHHFSYKILSDHSEHRPEFNIIKEAGINGSKYFNPRIERGLNNPNPDHIEPIH